MILFGFVPSGFPLHFSICFFAFWSENPTRARAHVYLHLPLARERRKRDRRGILLSLFFCFPYHARRIRASVICRRLHASTSHADRSTPDGDREGERQTANLRVMLFFFFLPFFLFLCALLCFGLWRCNGVCAQMRMGLGTSDLGLGSLNGMEWKGIGREVWVWIVYIIHRAKGREEREEWDGKDDDGGEEYIHVNEPLCIGTGNGIFGTLELLPSVHLPMPISVSLSRRRTLAGSSPPQSLVTSRRHPIHSSGPTNVPIDRQIVGQRANAPLSSATTPYAASLRCLVHGVTGRCRA